MKINIFKVVLAVIIGFCQIMPISAQTKAQLYKQFGSPSGESLPWCFWYWMYGAVSEEGITADIEAMKQAGIAYATEQIIDLFANGVNCVHIYTMNHPEIAGEIFKNLSFIAPR